MFATNTANLSKSAILRSQTTFQTIWHQRCSFRRIKPTALMRNDLKRSLPVQNGTLIGNGTREFFGPKRQVFCAQQARKPHSQEKKKEKQKEQGGEKTMVILQLISFYIDYFGFRIP